MTTDPPGAAGSGGNRRGRRASFGSVRKLPSGRFQARYTGPDGQPYKAPVTFDTKGDAHGWLSVRRSEIVRDEWLPESARTAKVAPITFGAYAESWLKRRELKARTAAHYRGILDKFILPRFGDRPAVAITPTDVADWNHDLGTRTGPTYRAHAYSLMRSICLTAVDEDVVTASPCRVRGAGSVRKAARKIEPATLAQLEQLTLAMPARLRAAILLAAWCALRFGEITELRRKDVDLRNAVVKVRRGVTRVGGEVVVDTPKSTESVRDVSIPPHLIPLLRDHIDEHAQWGRDGLLFPDKDGEQLAHSSMSWHFHKARDAAGRSDLHFHDLRHTGAVLAAQTGATLKELMGRLGHSTPAMAIRYQHVAQGRDAQIAAKLSEIANGVL
ncbi:tyrosine-type recombinase/integrase [Georgenia sp. M64]|uniref:tyrosine-type recombinase/integrase n=1 Tax=Georgenia sp. M64 TaxID=3120520 RepID=UPI0030E3A19B